MLKNPMAQLKNPSIMLFLTTCFALYIELIAIRWLSSEIGVFAYLKNIPLIISFLGLGTGVMVAAPRISIKKILPALLMLFVIMLSLSPHIGLSDIPIPSADDIWIWSPSEKMLNSVLRSSLILSYLFICTIYISLVSLFIVILFFIFFGIGELIRERLSPFEPLKAYSVDLLGSMAGVLLFTGMSFLKLSPFWWFILGFLMLFLITPPTKKLITAALITLAILSLGTINTFWSPYYRIHIQKVVAEKTKEVSTIFLNVNHVFFQQMANCSELFLKNHPKSTALQHAAINYNLPYKLITSPGNVLVVGAGTGNDVAAALRHGAVHVDAVEIDPTIVSLGKTFHPEAPYKDPRVSIVVDDARSFFEKNSNKYDTIVYGLLDSHTSVSAFSNVRLDNYVYTQESFAAAKKHLKKDGNLILSIAAQQPWILSRISAMLENTFGIKPMIFKRSGGGDGAIFVMGPNLNLAGLKENDEAKKLLIHPNYTLNEKIPTDDWPYLYLKSPQIPNLYLLTLGLVLILFVFILYIFIGKKEFPLFKSFNRENWHFFFLGAAFLLIETKSINELALLFGSTWIVNSSVILGILFMAFMANTITRTTIRISFSLIISGLFASLLISYFVKITLFLSEPWLIKFFLAGFIVALPIFFSGLLFSRSFNQTNQLAESFGANLLGAFFGGIIENSAMIIGIHALTIIAIMFYVAAVFSARLITSNVAKEID